MNDAGQIPNEFDYTLMHSMEWCYEWCQNDAGQIPNKYNYAITHYGTMLWMMPEWCWANPEWIQLSTVLSDAMNDAQMMLQMMLGIYQKYQEYQQ